jgi:hypothetical protein
MRSMPPLREWPWARLLPWLCAVVAPEIGGKKQIGGDGDRGI